MVPSTLSSYSPAFSGTGMTVSTVWPRLRRTCTRRSMSTIGCLRVREIWPDLLLCQPTHVDDQVPDIVVFGAIAFAGHLAPAVLDDIKELSVRHTLQRVRIGQVLQSQMHIGDQAGFSVAFFPMAHGAIDSEHQLGVGKKATVKAT